MNRREFVLASAGSAASILAGCATSRVASDGGPASVRTEPPELQAQKRRALEASRELGPTITDVEVRRRKNIPGNRAAFYLDDVMFVFRDLARDRPKSCWDHFLMSAFKEAYEKYWFKDYFAYQPDSRLKLLAAAKTVHDAGYEYCFIEEKVDW